MTSDATTEGMPGVLIEAGLSGLPVVATTAAGVNDVVEDGLTGFVVASDDPEELAERVERLLARRGAARPPRRRRATSLRGAVLAGSDGAPVA